MNNTMVTNNLNMVDDTRSLNRKEYKEDSMWSPKNMTIENAIKTKAKLNEREINTILLNLINRKRFSYSGADILRYLFDCICCKKINKIRRSQKYKNHFIFKKGEEKLLDELNVVNLLRM